MRFFDETRVFILTLNVITTLFLLEYINQSLFITQRYLWMLYFVIENLLNNANMLSLEILR